MQARALLAALAILVAFARSASAQSTDDAEADKPAAGGIEPDPTGTGEGSAPGDEGIETYDENGEPAGATENPNAPVTEWDKPAAKVKKAAALRPTGYPLRLVDRPLVLPRRMTEVAIELPLQGEQDAMGDASLHQSAVLRGSFGVTDRIQAGLRYGTGTFTSDGYEVGKSFALDADILLLDWVAAQVSLPVLVDPYSQGLTLGAPMKFTLFDQLSFVLLRDLLSFRLYRFVPNVSDAAIDKANADADAINATMPDGELNVNASVIYQQSDAMALVGRFGVRYPDFNQDAAPVLLDFGLQYSSSNKIDVGGRIGFADMGQTPDSFALTLFGAYRL